MSHPARKVNKSGHQPFEPRFDGSDTEDLVAQYLNGGGEVTKGARHSPSTGQMRYYEARRAQKVKENGDG